MESGTKTEHSSVEAFVGHCMDEELAEYTHVDLQELSYNMRLSSHKVRKELEGYGLLLAYREKEKEVRGFGANDHDRYYGKGSERCHGGSGHEQIAGFAGHEG